MSSELTYDDFLDRLSIQEVLVDAGCHFVHQGASRNVFREQGGNVS